MSNDPRWLTDDEQRSWRAFIHGSLRLWDLLDRDLREQHGISLSEYEVLSQLSEASGRRLRMADLAACTSQSRSRLSHTVSRLESDGLVTRTTCPEDGRGVFAQLTESGWALVVAAAKTHVAGVREYLVDTASASEFTTIGRVFGGILARPLQQTGTSNMLMGTKA